MPRSEGTTFDLDALVLELRAAAHESDPLANVRTIMDRVFGDPEGLASHVPEFADDDVILYEDDSISIWHCRFQPGIAVPPHDHQMSATIGVYAGIERNSFYEAAADGGIVFSNAVDMGPGRVLSIGPSAIHSVACTSDRPSCGIHVYLGPLTRVERSLYDLSRGEKLFFTEEAYERLKGPNGSQGPG